MMLFDLYDRASEAIGRIGADVRAEAQASNTTFSYTEPAFGTDVLLEYPGGRRERVMSDGSVVPIPPRQG